MMSKAPSSEYKLASMTRSRLRIVPACLALACATAGLQAPVGAQTLADASPAGAAPTVNAVWTEHEFTFTYFGRGTYYGCGGMDNKIEYILTVPGRTCGSPSPAWTVPGRSGCRPRASTWPFPPS
jgi:hypothetical protein